MRRIIFTFILFLSASAVPTLYAQSDPVAEVSARASKLIDSTMASLNLRVVRFNEELAKVNVVKKLDGSSLGKDVLPQNKIRIKDFLNYLEVYRTVSAKLMKEVEDSVEEIRNSMPAKMRAPFLKEFIDAYSMDQTTFDTYTTALTKFFTSIMDVFVFIESSKVVILDNKLQFSDKEEYEKYNKIIGIIEKNNKKLITASANAQRASIDASSMMQKAYNSIKK